MSGIFEYGRAGSGKTTLAATMVKLGYKVIFIDIDNKIRMMRNLTKVLTSENSEIWTIDSPLVEGTMRSRVLAPKVISKQPRGYLEICDILDGLEEQRVQGMAPPGDVLVVDSLSSMLEHLDRLMKFISGKDHFEFGEWASWKSYIEEFFYKMINLQYAYTPPTEEMTDDEGEYEKDKERWFKHIIIIAHEMTERDDITGKVEVLPMIDGSMRHKVGKFFEEMYHTEVSISNSGTATYQVLTKATDRYEARTSRDLKIREPSDYSILFADEMPKGGKGRDGQGQK